MIIGVVVQQPDERLDYDIKYDEWFDGDADALATAEINVIGKDDAIGLDAQVVVMDHETLKLWVIGGDDGEEYTLEITANTLLNRIKQNEVIVKIEDF